MIYQVTRCQIVIQIKLKNFKVSDDPLQQMQTGPRVRNYRSKYVSSNIKSSLHMVSSYLVKDVIFLFGVYKQQRIDVLTTQTVITNQ